MLVELHELSCDQSLPLKFEQVAEFWSVAAVHDERATRFKTFDYFCTRIIAAALVHDEDSLVLVEARHGGLRGAERERLPRSWTAQGTCLDNG